MYSVRHKVIATQNEKLNDEKVGWWKKLMMNENVRY